MTTNTSNTVKPADRKPKAPTKAQLEAAKFRYTLDGVEYVFPNPKDLQGKIDPVVEANFLIDQDNETHQIAFFLSMFKAASGDNPKMWRAIASNRELWGDLAKDWFAHYTEDGVSYPES